ncbi:MAG: hypothetical protein ACTSSH_06560, partial [Candidatus Heimdallarchaeota archaeon]
MILRNSYYSWNNTGYILFVNSFTLPSLEGYAILKILANDSLGNYLLRTYWITIDDTSPTIDLLFLYNHTKINDQAPITFNVEDLNDDTVEYVEYQWDLDPGPSSKPTDFSVSLLAAHLGETAAIIYLYARDVVGNYNSCEFHFELDFDPPTYNLLSTTNNSYLFGGEILDFDVTSLDINNFFFKWDDDEGYQTVLDPWNITAPILDGNHTLQIRLEDDAGLGIYPNFAEYTYYFIIDDI